MWGWFRPIDIQHDFIKLLAMKLCAWRDDVDIDDSLRLLRRAAALPSLARPGLPPAWTSVSGLLLVFC